MKIRINVTKRDIRDGDRCNESECAISLAIQRRLKPAFRKWCIVFHDIRIDDLITKPWVHKLPQVVDNWRSRFDAKKPVRPLQFFVDIPDRFLI